MISSLSFCGLSASHRSHQSNGLSERGKDFFATVFLTCFLLFIRQFYHKIIKKASRFCLLALGFAYALKR